MDKNVTGTVSIMYLCMKLLTSLKPLVRIHNDFAEMVTRWSSTYLLISFKLDNMLPGGMTSFPYIHISETVIKTQGPIADFIGLPYFFGFPSGRKSHVLISHDYLSQSKWLLLPRDRAAMCLRSVSKHQKKFCFVSKPVSIYCIRSED